ncbi:MAG: peptidoglycan editing factor PgeF [Desulfobulbaceae bacterium]|nr:peptidoglycan editing factor PgeF [Desulfobulbaceae bacterium]
MTAQPSSLESPCGRTLPPAPPVLTSQVLDCVHGMFCRLGGVSTGHFSALNLSFGVGDALKNVLHNRKIALNSLGLSSLVSLGQVHGEQILVLKQAPGQEEYQGYDAVISNQPGIALMIQQADCQAVLLHDPVQQIIAAIHCGWRGSVAGIIGLTISQMATEFAVKPANLRAVISPSLGPCCAEFINYHKELPEWMHAYATQDKPAHFDFWAISRRQLSEAGVRPGRIDSANICTRCNRDYFSFRRAKAETSGICGRNGSAIGLAAEQIS